MDSDLDPHDLDYTFTSEDVNKILERSAKKSIADDCDNPLELYDRRGEFQEIDFNYTTRASYSDLLTFARHHDVEKEFVDETVESYLSLNYGFRDWAKENLSMGWKGVVRGFVLGSVFRLTGVQEDLSPTAFSLLLTGFTDLQAYKTYSKSSEEVLRDDFGTLLGAAAGYYLTSTL